MTFDRQLAAEIAADLEKVCLALSVGSRFLAGLDQAAAAFSLQEHPRYSPLRTVFEQGHDTAERARTTLSQFGEPPASVSLPTTP
jgi:hypothetical protein